MQVDITIGRFKTLEELDTYERIWHKQIFEHSLTDIHTKVYGIPTAIFGLLKVSFLIQLHSLLSIVICMKTSCFKISGKTISYTSVGKMHETYQLSIQCRCLETCYPHFPTMDEFRHTIFSSVDTNSIQNELYLLSVFALEHHRLQAAGALLPDLLELYHWIHNELAYLVTHENAKNCTIQEMIEKGNEKYAGLDIDDAIQKVNEGENTKYSGLEHIKLYERVKGKWLTWYCYLYTASMRLVIHQCI